MSVTLKKTRGAARLSVQGAATVRDVAKLRESLLALADEGRKVILDLQGMSVCDAAFAQLMVSADLTFHVRSLSLEIIDPGARLLSAFPASSGDSRWVRV